MGERLSLSRSMGASVSLSEVAWLNPAVFLAELWLTLPPLFPSWLTQSHPVLCLNKQVLVQFGDSFRMI